MIEIENLPHFADSIRRSVELLPPLATPDGTPNGAGVVHVCVWVDGETRYHPARQIWFPVRVTLKADRTGFELPDAEKQIAEIQAAVKRVRTAAQN